MTVNAWLALRDDAQVAIVTRLTWDIEIQGVYSGPVTDRQAKVFGYIADRRVQLNLYKIDTFNTRDWNLWTVDFDLPGDLLQKIKAELDQLASDYPNQFKIIGAWHWDPGMPFGRQVGTQYVWEDVTRDVLVDDPDFVQPDPENPIEVPQITIQVTSPEITGALLRLLSQTPTYRPQHTPQQ